MCKAATVDQSPHLGEHINKMTDGIETRVGYQTEVVEFDGQIH
jgi:hypothetical protein